MRNRAAAEIEKLAEKDDRIYVLTGDLGYGVLDHFAEKHPDRWINAGISEENMTAVVAGIALSGNKVFTYSIGNFPVMRCLEWIRNDICYHDADVKILAVGGGFSYGQLGMSHHATEDLAIMRALPNMKVYVPADPSDAAEVIRHAGMQKGSCYIRLGKGKEPELHFPVTAGSIGKVIEVKKGGDLAILAAGPVIGEAVKAVRILKEEGIQTGLYQVIAIKPLDAEGITRLAYQYQVLMVLEEHNIIGGLGSAAAEVVSGLSGERAKLIFLGIKDAYAEVVGSQEYLREYYEISAKSIVKKTKELIFQTKSSGRTFMKGW